MKILVATESLNRGGLETLLCDELRCARRSDRFHDTQFTLLLSKAGGSLIRGLHESGQEIIIIERSGRLSFSYIFALRAFLKAREFDVVHVHSPIIGMYLLLAMVGNRTPSLQSIHGFFDGRSPSGRVQFFHHYLTKFLTRFTARSICVSHYLRRELVRKGLPDSKLVVVNNGLDFQRLKKRNVLQRKRCNRETYVFGMVGNFNYGRDHPTLLKGFRLLVERDMNVKLMLAGTGMLSNVLQREVADLRLGDKVEFVGECENVQSFLAGLDCFVYSSRSDTFGIAVIEALYFGLPAIVSDNGPFLELISDLPEVEFFAAGNARDLSQKMSRQIYTEAAPRSDKCLRRQKIEARFSIETHLTTLVDVYRQVCQRS